MGKVLKWKLVRLAWKKVWMSGASKREGREGFLLGGLSGQVNKL